MRNLHEVEINFPDGPSPDFFLKIDGKKIENIKGAVVMSAMAANAPYPVVKIEFYAKSVKGRIKGTIEES